MIPTRFQSLGELAYEFVADTLRSNGKIYVVVAVLLIIFAGISAFLIHLDRKISKLEKKQNS